MKRDKMVFSDGEFELEVKTGDESNVVWLTQKQISELFERDIKTINRHINDIYRENELDKSSTILKFEIVQIEGERKISRKVNHYLITKNHSFVDGDKRIAATIFLYLLDRNNKLFNGYGEKTIHDGTLVAITIMIAESETEEKELMIDLVMNFL